MLARGVLGDAWGGPYEGRAGPVDFQVPERAAISDDSQLTLATCESIIESGCVEPQSIARHMARCFAAGLVRGTGSSTLKALRDLAIGTHWALAGARGEYSAGNGAAMRIVPLAFLLNPDDSQDRVVIRDVCRITHHNDEAYAGALAVTIAIRQALLNRWSPPRTFLQAVLGGLPDSAVRDRVAELVSRGSSPRQAALQFGATGYVVDSVPLALCCAQEIARRPLQMVLAEAIALGGNTDTVASIAGQLAGAVAGVEQVPGEFVATIERSQYIVTVVDAFAEFVGESASGSP